MRKILFIVAFLLGFVRSSSLLAQDILQLKDGSKIKVNIVEVSEDYVKYRPWSGTNNERVVSIDRSLIRKITYEQGDDDVLNKEKIEKNYFIDDRKQAIKTSFTSFLLDGLALAYERALNPNSSFEGIIRYQGIGTQDNSYGGRRQTGLGVGAAYRFSLSGNSRKTNKNAHILAGWYVKPEVFFNYAKVPTSFYINNESIYDYSRYSQMGIMLHFGKQWVFANRFLLEGFAGIGYGFYLAKKYPSLLGNTTDIPAYGEDVRSGGEILGNNDRVFRGGFGLRIGYVFDTEKKKK